VRHRETAGQGARFVLLGAANTIATFLLYQALLFVLAPGVSYTLAYFTGLAAVSVLYPRYVFGVRQLTFSTCAGVFGYYLVSYVAGLQLLLFAERMVGNPRIAIVCVMAVMIPVNFVATRYLSLRNGNRGDGQPG